MLNFLILLINISAEHEKIFITLGPDQILQIAYDEKCHLNQHGLAFLMS